MQEVQENLAFESANACKNYAFRTLKISELTAQIRPENLSSRKVAEKLGMAVIKHDKKEENNIAEKNIYFVVSILVTYFNNDRRLY